MKAIFFHNMARMRTMLGIRMTVSLALAIGLAVTTVMIVKEREIVLLAFGKTPLVEDRIHPLQNKSFLQDAVTGLNAPSARYPLFERNQTGSRERDSLRKSDELPAHPFYPNFWG